MTDRSTAELKQVLWTWQGSGEVLSSAAFEAYDHRELQYLHLVLHKPVRNFGQVGTLAHTIHTHKHNHIWLAPATQQGVCSLRP